MPDEKELSGLKSLVDCFPFFVQARMLYVKALKETHSIHFAAEAKRMALYASDRRRLYCYLYPEHDSSLSLAKPLVSSRKASAGEYFDLMDSLEKKGGNTRQSLKELAERLKAAREFSAWPAEGKDSVVGAEISSGLEKPKKAAPPTEENARKLIREKKYAEALEILKLLNLNNREKNTYFADQIRFIEKIIINTKR